MSISDWTATPRGTKLSRPLRLTEIGDRLARDVVKAREVESTMYDATKYGGVTLSGLRSLMLTEQLRELAARTRPGVEVGPIDADDTLSRALIALAADLRAARHPRHKRG
jgi:hypothetical protein